MADSNTSTTPNANADDQRQKKLFTFLKKISATGYTLNGYRPIMSEWQIDKKTIIDIIYNTTKAWIEDVDSVSLSIETDRDQKSGERYDRLVGYVWIPSNSRHLVDNSLKESNSLVKQSIYEISPKLKEYLAKFSKDKNQKPFGAETRSGRKNNRVKGVEIYPNRFLQVEFDEKGYEYGKIFGQEFKEECEIKIYIPPEFRKSRDPKYVVVQKKLKTRNAKSREELVPSKSYNIR